MLTSILPDCRTTFLLRTGAVMPYLPTRWTWSDLLTTVWPPLIVEVLEGGNVAEAPHRRSRQLLRLERSNKEEAIAKKSWLGWKKRIWSEKSLPLVTGSLVVNVANQSFIGKMALQQLFQSDLPLTCQQPGDIRPSGTGESPLANLLTDWLGDCEDGVKGRREITMPPQWGSLVLPSAISIHITQKIGWWDLPSNNGCRSILRGWCRTRWSFTLCSATNSLWPRCAVFPTKEPFQNS